MVNPGENFEKNSTRVTPSRNYDSGFRSRISGHSELFRILQRIGASQTRHCFVFLQAGELLCNSRCQLYNQKPDELPWPSIAILRATLQRERVRNNNPKPSSDHTAANQVARPRP